MEVCSVIARSHASLYSLIQFAFIFSHSKNVEMFLNLLLHDTIVNNIPEAYQSTVCAF